MKSFSMLKMHTKVLLGFACAAVLAGLAGAIGDVNMKMLDDRDEALYGAATLSHQYLASATSAFQNLVLLNQKLRTDNSPESFAAAEADLAVTGEKLQHDLREYAWIMTDQTDQSAVVAASDACRKYIDDAGKYYRFGAEGQLFEAKQFHHTVLRADHKRIAAEFARMSDANIAETMRMRDENSEMLDSMRSLMFIIFGAVAASALALGFYFSHAIRKRRDDDAQSAAGAAAAERPMPLYEKADGLKQAAMLKQNAAPRPYAPAAQNRAISLNLNAVSMPASALAQSAPAESGIVSRPGQDPMLALAPAAPNQPVKKMRVFFDDTVEYHESESYR